MTVVRIGFGVALVAQLPGDLGTGVWTDPLQSKPASDGAATGNLEIKLDGVDALSSVPGGNCK